MKTKKSIWLAGVFTALGLAILLYLGFWQVDRLAWKTALLQQIEKNLSATPVSLPVDIDIKEWEYRKACAKGTFLHEKEMHLFSTSLNGNPGYHIYTPLRRDGDSVFIINRGWVPDAYKNPATRAEGQGNDVIQICGVLRSSREQGLFVPDANLEKNLWYTANAEEMADAAGFENVSPFLMDADDTPNPGGYPIGGQTRINIPNNHLGYAVTWFGLAVALLGVFIVFFITQRPKTGK